MKAVDQYRKAILFYKIIINQRASKHEHIQNGMRDHELVNGRRNPLTIAPQANIFATPIFASSLILFIF